jgi:hypothetical protein
VAERIKAVQRMFWSLVAVGLLVALLGVPVGNDAATMDALNELTAFEANFDRAGLERDLLARARAQGAVPLAAVASKVAGKGVPKLRAAASAQPVQPSAGLALATLGQVNALGRPGSTLDIGTASASAVGQSIAWRLSRQEGLGPQELLSVALTDTRCSDADLARERDVVQARATALESSSAAAIAAKRHEDAEQLTELRKKWKAPWKSILKANEKRLEALAVSEKAQATLQQDQQRYEALAKQAEGGGAKDGASAGCAIASVQLRDAAGGQPRTLRLPTPVEQRAVPVPPLSGVDFPVTHERGLWNEVEGSSVSDAIGYLRGRFSWHYRYVELGGLKLGGMTLLQFAPLALLPFFFALIRRSRGLSALYNPFDQPTIAANLPSVGFGAGSLNLLVLILLPLLACGLCAWSLFQIDQPPLVPLLCAIGSLALGGFSHVALHELLELRDAITRSHSNPPPAPSAP